MKLITVVGARPQFVKAAMVSRAIGAYNRRAARPIEERLLHTGQHYDENMSAVFFTGMGIPAPAWQLQGGTPDSDRQGRLPNPKAQDGGRLPRSGEMHGEMTGRMLAEIEKILVEEKPDAVVVYGDTNSTLAGALAAAKLHIPVAHVEAGLRSFNKAMPEEINRILTDHLASLLCCPTRTAVRNLAEEGIHQGVCRVGDVMYDAALLFGDLAGKTSRILSELKVESGKYRLCTVHRAENTDSEERLRGIFEAIAEMSTADCPAIVPLHPRTRNYLEKYQLMASLEACPGVRFMEPLPFLDMVWLEKNAATILTDSGGVQKEAYFHRTPCITLRDETEWVETVEAGWNQLAGACKKTILDCLGRQPARKEIEEYGTGNTADKIVEALVGLVGKTTRP